jgi:SAM-dependent methyltransferase
MSRRSDDVLLEHYRRLGNQANDFRNRNLRRLIASMVTGTSVLDIGCGSGHLLRLLEDQGKCVVGLEPSRELVDLAQALHGPLRIEHGSPEDIDEWPHRFDTITIIDVLEHIQDDVEQLRRMKALLKSRGRLVIVAPAFQALYGPRDAEQGHFRRYGRGDLVGKLHLTGYRITRVRYWNTLGFLPYFIASRVLPRLLRVDLRSAKEKGALKRAMIRVLDAWYRYFENRVNCGFGLSLIAVADKPPCDTSDR